MKNIYILLFAIWSIQVSGQCFPDRHSTTWYDAWVSCEKTENPNSDREDSHWIMYDLNKVYELGKGHFWNINDPSFLDYGVKKALIDLSVDGINWTFEDTLFLSQGTGQSIYEGEEAIDLEGAPAQFVLITVVETYGFGECAGFAELRVEREELTTDVRDLLAQNNCLNVKISPNPFAEKAIIDVGTSCEGNATYVVSNALGQVVLTGNVPLRDGLAKFDLTAQSIPQGSYTLTVRQGEVQTTVPFTRVE